MQADLERALKNATPRTIQSTLFNFAHAYERAGRLAWQALAESTDADFAAPAVMCQSFAIELLLKFFIASAHPDARTFAALTSDGVKLKSRSHSNLDLWDRVSAEHQAAVAATYARLILSPVTPHDFRDALATLGEDPFVQWRYVYEHDGVRHLDTLLLNRLSDALGETAAAIRLSQKA